MNLYTDDNPQTTLSGLGFKNKNKAIETIQKVEKYFDIMKKNQVIPGYTPDSVLPKKFITTKKQSNEYYNKQKLYRILGMSNRAKGMIHRVKQSENLIDAILIFDKWLQNYKLRQQQGGMMQYLFSSYPYCKCCNNNLQSIDFQLKNEICVLCRNKLQNLHDDYKYLIGNDDNKKKIKDIENITLRHKYIDILNIINKINNINDFETEFLLEIPLIIFKNVRNKAQEDKLLSTDIETIYSFYETYEGLKKPNLSTKELRRLLNRQMNFPYLINFKRYISILNLTLLKNTMKSNFIFLTNIIDNIDKLNSLYLENSNNIPKYLSLIDEEIKKVQKYNYVNLNKEKIVYYGENSPIIKIINHPSSLIYYQFNSIKLLILGEVHELGNTKYNDNYSLNFSDYINQLIDYDVCFDLFIEDKISKILSRQTGGDLFSILLGDHSTIIDNNINLRYHTWDIRTLKINGIQSNLFSEFKQLDSFITQRNEFIPISNFIEVFITEYIKSLFDLTYPVLYIHEIINDIKKLNPEIDLKLFLIHFQVVRNLIHKQIIKSRIVELSGKTIKFIRNLLIDTYVKLQITDLDFIPGLSPESYSRNHTDFEKNKRDSRLGFIGLITTDIYLLFRVFTKFNNKSDRPNNPTKCNDEYLQPRNIIVYGGLTHTSVFNYLIKIIFEIDPLIEIINNIEDSINNTYVELDNPHVFF